MAFVPWVLFTLITQHVSLPAAAVVALASIAISLPSILAGRPRVLELGAVLAFAGFTAVAFATDPATGEWVAGYARAVAAGLLALIALGRCWSCRSPSSTPASRCRAGSGPRLSFSVSIDV